MHYWPTRKRQACYSPRYRRDGRAGATIIYYLRIYCGTNSLPVTRTTGRMEQRTPPPIPPGLQYLPRDCGPDGFADGWTKQECTVACGRHDHTTYRERADA